VVNNWLKYPWETRACDKIKLLSVFGRHLEFRGKGITGKGWHGDRWKAHHRKHGYSLWNFISRWHRTWDIPGGNLPSHRQLKVHVRFKNTIATQGSNAITLQPFDRFGTVMCTGLSNFTGYWNLKFWQSKMTWAAILLIKKLQHLPKVCPILQNFAWWCRFRLWTLGLT